MIKFTDPQKEKKRQQAINTLRRQAGVEVGPNYVLIRVDPHPSPANLGTGAYKAIDTLEYLGYHVADKNRVGNDWEFIPKDYS